MTMERIYRGLLDDKRRICRGLLDDSRRDI